VILFAWKTGVVDVGFTGIDLTAGLSRELGFPLHTALVFNHGKHNTLPG